jgi:hypothetical protein
MRQDLIEFGARLQRNYGSAFAANPRLKRSVSRLLESELPPSPRRPGRPGFPDVTKAEKMLNELHQMLPGEPYHSLWQNIYPACIEGHDSLNKLEKRAAEQELRDRVRWRRRARRKRASRELNRIADSAIGCGADRY